MVSLLKRMGNSGLEPILKTDSTHVRATIGDSLSVGGNGPAGTGLATLLADRMHGTWNCPAQGGNACADQSSAAFQYSPGTGDLYTLWLGTNDKNIGKAAANPLAATQAAHLAMLLHLGTKEGANKVHGQSMSTTGTWVNLGATTDPKGIGTITTGSTCTAVVTGTNVALVGFWQQTNSATFTVTIDGVSKGSFSAQPPGNNVISNVGLTTGPFALVFSGLSNASHTVLVTCTVPSSSVVYIGFIAGYGSTLDTTNPLVVVGNTHDFTAAGNTAQSDTTAENTSYKTAIASNVTTVQGLGLNVTLVDVDALIGGNASLLASDGLHANDAGYALVLNAFVSALGGT